MVKKFFTSIWFLAFIISVPILIMLPDVFNKYSIELDKIEKRIGPEGYVYFKDLQNDGELEMIESFHAEINLFSFQVFETNQKLYDQFNFPFEFNARLSQLHFFDLDEDNLIDVIGLSVKKDSVFMSFVDPYDSLHQFQTFFITTIDTTNRTDLDVSVPEMQYFDFDKDNNKEMVFSIAVGYNWFPRKLFVFHPDSKELQTSQQFGVHFNNLSPFDYKNDGEAELLCISSSAKNIPDNFDVKYLDDRPRIFVFDNNLDVVFTPVEFPPGIASRVSYFFLDKTMGELIVLYNSYSSENERAFLTRININGDVDNDTLFFQNDLGNSVRMYQEKNGDFLIVSSRGNVLHLDNN